VRRGCHDPEGAPFSMSPTRGGSPGAAPNTFWSLINDFPAAALHLGDQPTTGGSGASGQPASGFMVARAKCDRRQPRSDQRLPSRSQVLELVLRRIKLRAHPAAAPPLAVPWRVEAVSRDPACIWWLDDPEREIETLRPLLAAGATQLWRKLPARCPSRFEGSPSSARCKRARRQKRSSVKRHTGPVRRSCCSSAATGFTLGLGVSLLPAHLLIFVSPFASNQR